ncbi:MAG: hypothetical protein WDM85_14320 [Caulobacteraceae bacterium]
MRRLAAVIALAVIGAAPRPARAGETACWVDNGAVVVAAAFTQPGFGDVTGDFILDLSAPHSQLHLTTAQSDGMGDATEARGVLTLAGERIAATLAVTDLDDRQWGFPTTLNGLIGADVLAGYVVELRFAPCRLTLWRRAPRSAKAEATLPVTMVGGVPTVAAMITDGAKTRSGQFAIDTGAAGVRIVAANARFSRLSARADPLSRDRPPARLAALSLGGRVFQNQPAALQEDAPDGLLGGIGTDFWLRYVLRLDLKRDQLELISPGVSAPRSSRSPGSSRRAGRRTPPGR